MSFRTLAYVYKLLKFPSFFLSLLPSKNREILKNILKLAYKIDQHSQFSKMTSNNLAIIFYPILFPNGLITHQNDKLSHQAASESGYQTGTTTPETEKFLSSSATADRDLRDHPNSEKISNFSKAQSQMSSLSKSISDRGTTNSLDSILTNFVPENVELDYICFLIKNYNLIFNFPSFLKEIMDNIHKCKSNALDRRKINQFPPAPPISQPVHEKISHSLSDSSLYQEKISNKSEKSSKSNKSNKSKYSKKGYEILESDDIEDENLDFGRIYPKQYDEVNFPKILKHLPPATPKLTKHKKAKTPKRSRNIDQLKLSPCKTPKNIGGSQLSLTKLPNQQITPKAAKLLVGLGVEKLQMRIVFHRILGAPHFLVRKSAFFNPKYRQRTPRDYTIEINKFVYDYVVFYQGTTVRIIFLRKSKRKERKKW